MIMITHTHTHVPPRLEPFREAEGLQATLRQLVSDGLFVRGKRDVSGQMAEQVGGLAAGMAQQLFQRDEGAPAEGLASLLGDALKQANVNMVKNMYVREVQKSGFEAPFTDVDWSKG